MQNSDKRAQTRLEMILKVEYGSAREFLADYTANISQGGLFIATARVFQPRDIIHFEISFPGLLQPIRCRGQVRWMRGAAEAGENRPQGIGVEFLFENPQQRQQLQSLVAELTKSLPAPAAEGAPETGKSLFRVLLAEDNHIVLEMVRYGLRRLCRSSLLQRYELQVFEAENGQRAWDSAQGRRLDLAIIDYYMPVLDGGQLIRRLRGHPDFSRLPIIAVSVGGEEARRASYDAGADLFLDKPIVFEKLFDSIARLLCLGREGKGG